MAVTVLVTAGVGVGAGNRAAGVAEWLAVDGAGTTVTVECVEHPASPSSAAASAAAAV